MATEGPRSGGTFASDAGVGTVAWTSPGNAVASDDSRATAALTAVGTVQSHYLKCTNFGFSAIPDGATVDGIEVVVEASATSTSGTPQFLRVRLVKGGVISSSTALDNTNTVTTTDASYTSGGPTNLGGETWAATDIKSSGFGVAVSMRKTGIKTSTTVRIDHVTLKVYYTAGAATFTATATLTTGGAELTASGTVAAPVYTGSAALTTGGVELAASGTVTAPAGTLLPFVVNRHGNRMALLGGRQL